MPTETTLPEYQDIVNRLGVVLRKLDDITNIDTSEMKQAVDTRMSWDEYFMGMAHVVAQRSSCTRRRVGAIAVKDRRIVATGYNGVPAGFKHCTPNTCVRGALDIPSGQLSELCFAVHAEQNLLVQAAAMGATSLAGSVIYCTTFPCTTCTKLLVSCRIGGLYYSEGYPDTLSLYMLRQYTSLFDDQQPFVFEALAKPTLCI